LDFGRLSRNQISARQPLLWGALAFSAGLWAGKYIWRPPSWWVIAALVFLRCRSLFPEKKGSGFVHSGAEHNFCDGRAYDSGPSASPQPESFGNGNEVVLTVHVIAEGNIQSDGMGSFHQRIDIETEKIEAEGRATDAHIGVRLSIYSQARPADAHSAAISPMQLLRYGQRIRFAATLNAPRNFRHPGAFDYAGYLRDHGIEVTASTKYAGIELLPGFAGSRVELWRARVHRSVIQKIHALWPERVAGLMDAIVIGEESFIDRPTRVDFQRSGTYHVLVVSGMNVSILAMFTLWTLRRLGVGDIAASVCAIALILAYAALTNVGPPVWRAALMFAVYLATRLLYRDRAMLNALGAAALAMLIVDPNALYGASFQMTFLCIVLVAGIGIPLLERTIEP